MEKRRTLKSPATVFLLLPLCFSLLYVSCGTQASSGSPTTTATTMFTCGKWTIAREPNPGTYYNTLNSIAAISASDVWAVGNYANSNSSQKTLTEHWNGSKWSVVNSPNPNSEQVAELMGVAALSAKNVWAVGDYFTKNSSRQTLIEHWNGLTWSIVSSPNPNGNNDWLNSVAAISANDTWAVGYYTDNKFAEQTLIEHWNGSAWSIISSPNPSGSTNNLLVGVTAVSTNNIWAVGSTANKHSSQALIEHWNGSAWSIVSSPNTHSNGNTLNSVTAISSTNIWAVGYSYAQYGYPSQTLIEHWNGSTWSVVSSPNVAGSQNDDLHGLVAISGGNIWAVGHWDTGSQSYRVLIEHWNGSKWSIVASPNVGPIPNVLLAITLVPANKTIWAVGNHFTNGNLFALLIERYC